ncbi:hypothetical protein P7F60_06225 [Rhizobium sp. YJ-22]|uniref:hypothetical protein n=1 Tax=Rhizobium sp. YJ-22 TaxID=3037556 RepID=UPI002412C807|nr:hypothetical protein [Rhizobium sp. YJ-22]MDG3575972.1 hypothetical protein [Rhizobium sp. YJ-22]
MSVLKTRGRADIAAAYKALAAIANHFMIAFGAGQNWWGSQQQVLLALDGDGKAQINPTHVPVTAPVIRSADGVTLYQVGTDYLISTATGAIERVVSGAIAGGATLQVSYTARVPEPDLTTQVLVDEVGRVPVSSVQFILPFAEANDAGAPFVVIEGAKYALSATPTRMLLFSAVLNATDGVGDPIREYALFSGCAVDAGLPPGQTYFEPADIVTSGACVIAKHRSPVPHDGTVGLAMSIILEI